MFHLWTAAGLMGGVLRRNILIFHTGALGDFILTWPLALALGRIYAQSRIILVTHGEKGRLAAEVLRVEARDIEAGWHGLFSDSPDLPESAVRLMQGAQAIFSFISDGEDIWADNVRSIAPDSPLMALRSRPAEPYGAHASAFLLEQLRSNVPVEAAVRQILRSIAERGVGTRRSTPDAAVVIHPGSGAPAKNWPIGKFIELVEALKQKHPVRAILGEVETERWSSSMVAELEAAVEVRRPGNYVDLYRELCGASLFIGNDSGPGHLAGIIGMPTVSLFGSTDAVVWRPLGPRVETVWREPIEGIEVDDVIEAIASVSE